VGETVSGAAPAAQSETEKRGEAAREEKRGGGQWGRSGSNVSLPLYPISSKKINPIRRQNKTRAHGNPTLSRSILKNIIFGAKICTTLGQSFSPNLPIYKKKSIIINM